MTSKYTLDRALLMFLIAFILLLSASYSHGHSGSLNKVAMGVCEEKVKSQACQYEGGHSDLYIGTCQYISETDLICVRNRAIQTIVGTKIESEEEHDAKIKGIRLD